MSHTALAPAIYGLVAEFDTSTELVEAAQAAYAAGYRKMDAYSPFPIEEASEAIGFHKSRVPLVVLLGGL
ncbi:MAG TPA: quinol:electron acceptor oxidoreductase subunit ActD, partial [Terriglobales bacterium]|nr:quinol:electron acceptor oxidoreductase subunit ActD [Terriglobales bacterium]